MAGVGFGLRKLSSDESYAGALRVYGSAALISSGPWLISILSLLFVGVFAARLAPQPADVERFQVAVTWLFALSLALTTPLQLVFTRFVSDLFFLKRPEAALPNLWGALSVTTLLSSVLAMAALPLFDDCTPLTKALLGSIFVVLCNAWIAIVMLTGIRQHWRVLGAFLLGYAVTLLACGLLAPYGEQGLLLGFLLGQVALLFWSCRVIAQAEPGDRAVRWEFLERRKIFLTLLPVGLCFSLGTWADKLLFWFHPATSHAVVGPFRASEIYDLPIFLAYLASAPGMAAFLLKVETDYAEQHERFFAEIQAGASLGRIEALRDELTASVQSALESILKAQGATLLACALWGRSWLEAFGISRLHLPLFLVDAAAVSMQVLVLAIMSIYFYLDRRRTVLWISALLLVLNTLLSALTLRLGAAFFGYGFAAAALITMLVALAWLRRDLRDLVRDTFMMQGVAA